MRHMVYGTVLCLFIGVASAQASPSGTQNAATPGGEPAVFVAHDYGFSGPDRLPAGRTTVRILNEGQDLHHIQFLKLLRGKSASDFRAAIKADAGRLPSWVEYAGGPRSISRKAIMC